MKKTLIIKRISNDFDRFVCQSLEENLDEVVAIDAFKISGKVGRKLINILKNCESDFLFEMILSIRKKEIKNFKQIILFDDYPDIHLIKWIKKNNPSCTIKLWFWNVPNYSIEIYRDYCEMYCFDKIFSDSHGISFINQFYFEPIANKYYKNTEPIYDLTYIGIDKDRSRILLDISSELDKIGVNYNFNLVTDKQNLGKGIQCRMNAMSYSGVINLCVESKAILELVHSEQKGLTWRALEALFFQRKLVTNNNYIKYFDFYNKNNIFIYGEDSIDDFLAFIASPYEPVSREIVDKYTVRNWFEQITQ